MCTYFSIAISTCLPKPRNYRDCGYTCNPHEFEIPALRFPCRVPVIPCKHLQCRDRQMFLKNFRGLHDSCKIPVTNNFRAYIGRVHLGHSISYFFIRFLNHNLLSLNNFSYFVIRFLLISSLVKSDNEIIKVDDKKNLIWKSDNEIGKKVLTDGLDPSNYFKDLIKDLYVMHMWYICDALYRSPSVRCL